MTLRVNQVRLQGLLKETITLQMDCNITEFSVETLIGINTDDTTFSYSI